MNQANGEEAIAKADKANSLFLAAVSDLKECQSSDETLPQDSNGQSFPTENEIAVPVIDAVLAAANEAKVAEEIAIRLNFSRLAQQKKIRESHRVWNEQIRQYEAQRIRILSGTSPTQVVINAQSDDNSKSATAEVASKSTSDHASDVNSVAGNFCLAGGLLVAIGSFLPYVVATSGLGISLSRNAFQLGQNLSMTYHGPLIVAAGVLLVLRGLNLKGVIGLNVPGYWSPIGLSILAGICILNAWLASFPASSTVSFNRGYGGIVSLVGVLSGFVAVYVRRQNT